MPDLVKNVLNTLKNDVGDIDEHSAIDILHASICKVMNGFCQDELHVLNLGVFLLISFTRQVN